MALALSGVYFSIKLPKATSYREAARETCSVDAQIAAGPDAAHPHRRGRNRVPTPATSAREVCADEAFM